MLSQKPIRNCEKSNTTPSAKGKQPNWACHVFPVTSGSMKTKLGKNITICSLFFFVIIIICWSDNRLRNEGSSSKNISEYFYLRFLHSVRLLHWNDFYQLGGHFFFFFVSCYFSLFFCVYLFIDFMFFFSCSDFLFAWHDNYFSWISRKSVGGKRKRKEQQLPTLQKVPNR